MPRPPCDRHRERFAWVKRSKTCGSNSASMPMPSSRICTTACSPSRRAVTQIWPGLLLYLAALLSRFVMTWAIRTGSASIQIGAAGSCSTTSCPCDAISGWAVSSPRSIASFRRSRCLRIWTLPRMIRETSNRSSTSRTRCWTWCFIMSRAQAAVGASTPSISKRSRPLRIGANGLRSSWANIARNSSLRRSASFCSLMLRTMPTNARRPSM